ncbi:MAG: LLM class flavin-dependent oxidoreductase [Acetobacteraceae bacterium]|nr:LLM class flavin-dependent oxidoreductase [Acetobacteraceae bacterium]
MQLGIVCIPRPLDGVLTIDRFIEIGRKVEELEFSGLWVTDAFGRGFPTIDPLVLLGTLCGVTKTIELGTCVVQIPLRHPVEHAHRVQSLHMLSNGRLRLGVGSGSTQHDFDAVEADFSGRSKTLTSSLDVMRRTWAGEGVFGPPLSIWPGTEGGPPVLLGAWRSQRWINLAAGQLQGWIASGIYSDLSDLAIGTRIFHEASGKRSVLANIFTDFRGGDAPNNRAATNKITLYCTPGKAREQLKRIADLGFDDALLVVPFDAPDQLGRMRDLM